MENISLRGRLQKYKSPTKASKKITFDQEQQQQMFKFFRNFLKAVVHIV